MAEETTTAAATAAKSTKKEQEIPPVGARVVYVAPVNGERYPADVMAQTGGTGLRLSVNTGTEHVVRAEVLHINDKQRNEKEHSGWEAL